MKHIVLISIIIILFSCKKDGCIKGDCSNGFGIQKYSNGGIDKGIWENGKMNGYGIQIQGKGEFDGDIYEGFFKNGEYSGKGTYYFSKYDAKLIGEFLNGMPNGKCSVFFGSNSSWEGTFTGTWKDGYSEEFNKYVETTKDGEQYIFTAVEFFDTINYYYNHAKIQRVIDEIKTMNHLDLTKEQISQNEIAYFVDYLSTAQYNITYSMEMIKSFKEYDKSIPYKEAMIDYLDCFKSGFEKEFSNWMIFIQLEPNKDKPELINKTLQPFIDKVQSQTKNWKKIRDGFKIKYDIEVELNKNNS
jgi:hypothetical protein